MGTEERRQLQVNGERRARALEQRRHLQLDDRALECDELHLRRIEREDGAELLAQRVARRRVVFQFAHLGHRRREEEAHAHRRARVVRQHRVVAHEAPLRLLLPEGVPDAERWCGVLLLGGRCFGRTRPAGDFEPREPRARVPLDLHGGVALAPQQRGR